MSRVQARVIKSGSFVWRVRKGVISDQQYAAGERVARLIEAMKGARPNAGLTDRVASDRRPGGGAGVAKIAAAEELAHLGNIIGQHSLARIIHHVVLDKTVTEIAAELKIDARDMSAIIRADLDALGDALGLQSSATGGFARETIAALRP